MYYLDSGFRRNDRINLFAEPNTILNRLYFFALSEPFPCLALKG